MKFSNWTDQIRQSESFEDVIGPACSPIMAASPETPSFRKSYHRRDASGGISIDQDINCFISPYPKYKCFKCYGLYNTLQIHGSAPLCQQCDGSEYINEVHPIASLFGKILKAKLSPLLKPESARSNTIDISCQNCLRSIDEDSYWCDNCPDYILCVRCYQGNDFLHLQRHTFTKKSSKSLVKLKQALPTMKKISQQLQSQQAGTVQEQLFCSLCKNLIEEMYHVCIQCSLSRPFMICISCQQNSQHDPSHTLDLNLYTNKKGSKLLSLSNKPSQSKSQGYLSSIVQSMEYQVKMGESLQNSDFKQTLQKYCQLPTQPQSVIEPAQQSVIFIPTLNLEESSQYTEQCESPGIKVNNYSDTQSLSIDETRQFNPQSMSQPPSPPSPQKKKPPIRADSVVRIKLQDSLDMGLTFNLDKSFGLPRTKTAGNFTIKQCSQYQIEQQDDYLFNDYQCDICQVLPIRNIRYHCLQCEDYDICDDCHRQKRSRHQKHHQFQRIDGRQIVKQRERKALEMSQRPSFGIVQRKSNFHLKIPTSGDFIQI